MQIIKSPYNMVKKCSLFLLGLFAMIHVATAQVTVNISDDAADVGGTVDLDVTYDNFDGIISFQYSIVWDTLKFEFNSIQNVTSELDQFTASSISTPEITGDNGFIKLSWSKSNTQPESLPNGTRLYTLRLNAIGEACDRDDVRLSNNPTPIEFANTDAEDVGAVPNNGVASINGNNCNSGLTVTIDDLTVDAGTNQCVPVRVENLVDMQGVQFNIGFDPTIISYTGFQNANLPSFSGGNINDLNADQGQIFLLWTDETAVTPFTFDGVLIEFCFDAVGTDGQTSPITLEEDIEFSNSDEESVIPTINNGSITITGEPDPNGFTLIAGDAAINMGQAECIPISVRNFTDIQSMQFIVRWDPDALIYSEVTNLNLMSLTAQNISPLEDNRIRVSWAEPTGVTIPDNTVIFELCLEAKGDCENTTPIQITSDPFVPIEVSNTSNEELPVSVVSGSVTIDCDGCTIAIEELVNPSCPGEADGSIRVNLGSPGTTYTCTWKDDAGNTIQESSDCDLLNVQAGTYTLDIDDGNDCQQSRTFTLEDAGNIIFGGSKVNETENCDGSINIEMMGGSGEFEFLWDDGSTSAIRTMLCAGEYCVTATDENNCTAENCFTIQAGGPVPCGIDITNVRCNGGNDGEIDLCIEGGTGPYTVSWSGPSGDFNTEDISGLSAGTYNYTITDSSDPAISSNGSVVVEEPDAIVASASIVGTTEMDGSIDLSVSGGTAPYTFLWSPGDFMIEDPSGLASGEYTVTVTDENNCMESFTFRVPNGIFSGVEVTSASCNNMCDGSIGGTITGGEAPYTFRLDGAAVTFPINDLCPNEYSFEITDANGQTATETVVIANPDPLTVEEVERVNCTSGQSNGSITVEVTGGTGDYEYNWNTTGDGPRIFDLTAGEYNVVVTDERGCTATLPNAVRLTCGDGACFTARTIITPNGDSFNNEFEIMCAPNTMNNLLIFDRWGRTVFTQENYDNTWIGTDQNGEELPDGGYLWVLEITNGDGSKELKRGSVTIVRDQF